MPTSVYLAGTEARSGKSAVAVGLLHRLAGRVGRVGVFRPIVRGDEPDVLVETLLAQLPTPTLTAERARGVTYDDVHRDLEGSMGVIVDRFHALADTHDVILVVGSDFTDVSAPTELVVNAQIAANLGSPMVLVVPALDRAPEELVTATRIAVSAAMDHHAHVAAVVANQVPESAVIATRDLLASRLSIAHLMVEAIPETPILRAPTVRDLMTACEGQLIHGDPALLDRESLGLVVAAMTMPHVLDRLIEGGVVIAPGDRDDVVLGTLLAHRSHTFPNLSGLVLNGGFDLAPQVRRLIEGLDIRLPIIATPAGTMDTATTLSSVRGRITPESTRKVEASIALVDDALNEAIGHTLWPPSPTSRTDSPVTPLMFEHRLVERARSSRAHIVLPEGTEPRILQAASTVRARGIAQITLLGTPDDVRVAASAAGVDLEGIDVVDPLTSPLRERFAREYAELRAHKGVRYDHAFDHVADGACFGTMMVNAGLCDGMVAGSVTTTAHTIRPALEIVRTEPDVSIVSSVFFMCLADRVLVYGDCAVNPDPTAEQLADIAISSAGTARRFGIEPLVAMLSYSTGGSGSGADVDKVREATGLVRLRAPDLLVEGPIQYDAAVDPRVAATKLKDSPVAGRATVLVFPDLNTGNNTYKAVQRSAAAVAIGPVLQGLRKPVNDLSRGALVRDIVNTIAITAIQGAPA